MKKILILSLFVFPFTVMSQNETKVMTYNIKFDDRNDQVNGWEKRKDEVVGLIRYHNPLIIGTQEGLKNQLDYMKAQLDGYDYFGVARDDGKEMGEYTAIFYNTKKLRLKKQGTFWLSTSPEEPSKAWDAALPRICTWAEMKNGWLGKRFFVFNAHFDHVGVEARKNSIAVILDMIEKYAGKAPVILMGDFNFEEDKSPYAIVTSKLKDARAVTKIPSYGPKATFNGFAFDKEPQRRIDYIFVNNKVSVLNYATLSESNEMRYPSDHFPVLVTIEFSK